MLNGNKKAPAECYALKIPLIIIKSETTKYLKSTLAYCIYKLFPNNI